VAYTYTRHYNFKFVNWQTISDEIIHDLAWLYNLDTRISWHYVDNKNEHHYQRTYIFDNLDDYAAFVLARG